jgi:hypothetical protein
VVALEYWRGGRHRPGSDGAGVAELVAGMMARQQKEDVSTVSNSYEGDILTWSERQADLLRRVGAGEKVNDQVDWDNVAEEVESVGRSQLAQVKSLLVQALAHMLKAEAWPLSGYVPHWRAEALGFRGDAADVYTPSMRQRIDINELYARAVRRVPETIDGQAPLPVPEECPVTLEELLAAD